MTSAACCICACANKMPKQQYLWTWCQSVVPNDAPRDFGPEVAFGAKFQIPFARQGGRVMSAPRPYVTEPFRPLSSINIIGSNSNIYNSILVISSMWSLKSVLRWCIFNDCACALSETLLFMVKSRYRSCVFSYGTRWCILAQNTRHPRMCIVNKIVRYLVWISFLAALVATL